jgi:hypothetical protein
MGSKGTSDCPVIHEGSGVQTGIVPEVRTDQADVKVKQGEITSALWGPWRAWPRTDGRLLALDRELGQGQVQVLSLQFDFPPSCQENKSPQQKGSPTTQILLSLLHTALVFDPFFFYGSRAVQLGDLWCPGALQNAAFIRVYHVGCRRHFTLWGGRDLREHLISTLLYLCELRQIHHATLLSPTLLICASGIKFQTLGVWARIKWDCVTYPM